MKYIKTELEKYLNIESLDNIVSSYPKIMGVRCKLNLCPNDNDRFVGRLILIYNSTKNFMLNETVEFLEKKKQWISSIKKDNTQLFLVDPFFVRKYIPNPIVPCLVEVLNPTTKEIEYTTLNLRYKQFMKRRLLEKTGNWPYGAVKAVENFNTMLKHGKYKAINSTVRNYFISQDELKSYIGKRATIIRDINREWQKLVAHNDATKDI